MMNSSERSNDLIVVQPVIVSLRKLNKGLFVVLLSLTVSLIAGITLLTKQRANMKTRGSTAPIQYTA